MEDGYVESFNSRIRDECLNMNSFWSSAQARVVISDWKNDYNHCESALIAGLPTASPLRCHLYPPMNDSRSPWTSPRGPVTTTTPIEWVCRDRPSDRWCSTTTHERREPEHGWVPR